ncbi:hydrogenase [Microaerobacter geothermalis]|uniref:hydrogenase n=1 Tax=Microaerobacter geothermalis TaxID=674972 RepID=UPI001F274CF8|nr:hydrogenase [Microaerobacter geothermalis]MCF6093066.1 hydrogenase [Microaerobacter geothermalis]
MNLDILSLLLLIASVLILQVKKISSAVKLLSFQSVILAFLAGMMAYLTDISHLFIIAILTLLIKALVIPYILLHTIIKIDIKREVERFMGRQATLLAAFILVILGYYVTSRLELPTGESTGQFLPASIILILHGAYTMITHKKAIMQGIGLITIENGLFLLAMTLTYGMPMFVELGIFFDLLIAVIIIGLLSYRINTTFESLNTDKLQNLKG